VSADGDTTSFLTSAKEEAEYGRWSPNGDEIVYVTREKEYFSGRLNLLKFHAAPANPPENLSRSTPPRPTAVVDGLLVKGPSCRPRIASAIAGGTLSISGIGK
jgi:hypothetical protein